MGLIGVLMHGVWLVVADAEESEIVAAELTVIVPPSEGNPQLPVAVTE